jgi:hypothetical protein
MLARRKMAIMAMAITWRRLSAARLRRTGADVGECGVKPRCCLARPALAVGVAGGGANHQPPITSLLQTTDDMSGYGN